MLYHAISCYIMYYQANFLRRILIFQTINVGCTPKYPIIIIIKGMVDGQIISFMNDLVHVYVACVNAVCKTHTIEHTIVYNRTRK
jgi:hypothetical protein